MLVVGSGNALTYDPDNPQARAAYLEPAHTSIKVMLEERQAALEDIQRLSRLGGDITGNRYTKPLALISFDHKYYPQDEYYDSC